MSAVTIRELTLEEACEVFYWLPSYSFRPTPPLPDLEQEKEAIRSHTGATHYALYEGDQAVTCAGSLALTQQVRGAMYQSGGVFDVVTHPSARRKGYARQVMAHMLEQMHAQGQAFSCLYPFRESFYERMGYVSLPQTRVAKFCPLNLGALLKRDLGGEVTYGLTAERYDDFRAFTQRLQAQTHGMALFREPDLAWAKRNRYWQAEARVNGEVVGLMLYQLKEEKFPEMWMRVTRFLYLTSQGKYLLLDWIARHADQVCRAEVLLPAYEFPETWLPDLKIAVEPFFVPPMARVVDVAALVGMQAGSGRFTVQVSDPLCPWNEGAWQFEGVDGRLSVRPAHSADCSLSIQAVSALVMGAQDCGDFAFRGWGSADPAALAQMRSLFPRLQPQIFEFF